MPTVRLTAFFKDDDGHGWSEQHDKDGGSSIVSLTTFLNNFDNLMRTLRRPLLSGDAFYIGCRASYKTSSGGTAGDNILLDPPLRGPQTFSGNALEMGAPESAVKIRVRNDASTAKSDIYIRGQWKEIIAGGVLNFATLLGDQWKMRCDAYVAGLIAGGYGWVGIDPSLTSRGNVTGYAVNLNKTIKFTCAATNGVPLPVTDTKMAIEFSRINNSNSILNRSIVCFVTTAGADVDSVKVIGVTPFESAGTYVAPRKNFIPYAGVSYYKAGQRKTGRPFGVGRGRSSALVLH